MTSLNPVYRVGDQIVEQILAHQQISKDAAGRRAVELLRQVGIPNPERRVDAFPHQFSGGMRQRAMIAMGLSCNPDILIADEPTTALDVTIQAQIIELIGRLKRDFNSAVILITHDLGVVAEIADEIIVMYAGRVVERAQKRDLFYDSQMPYTWGLLGSIPRLDQPRPGAARLDRRRAAVADQPPARVQVQHALPARLRQVRRGAAAREPRREAGPPRPLLAVGRGQARAPRRDHPRRGRPRLSANGSAPLVEVRSLRKYFPIKKGVLQREVGRVHAVDDVSFAVREGETLGLVGESGCGKSTLGRCVVRLLEPTEGEIVFDGRAIGKLGTRALRPLRREMQMVFQDPYASLNPRKRVGSIIGTPLKIHGVPKAERRQRVQELLETVGLSPEHYNRFPHEFSGGQRQRIGVARALALRPRLIVADEPVSALDVSIQAQMVNLLEELQEQFALTYIFIAHDLGVVRHVSDRIAVMYLGKLVELSPAEELYTRPIMPYTEALLSAVPIPDPDLAERRERIVLQGDVPSPIDPPSGCRFHPRCRYMTEVCREVEPPLTDYGNGHLAACHHPLNVDAETLARVTAAPETPDEAREDVLPADTSGPSHPVTPP